jgi:hypothetical protein
MTPFLPPPVLPHLDAILCRHHSARLRLWALVAALGASAVIAMLG